MAVRPKSRIFSLDIVRGVFILLMIIAHSIYFFHTGSNVVLTTINQFADLVSFTGLLFISGAVSYSAYIHFRHPSDSVIKRILKRLIWYFAGYYILAIIGNGFTDISIESIIQILTFQKFVPFTEFLIPFLLFGLLIIPLRNIYRFLSSSIIYTAAAGVVIYMIGSVLSAYSVPDFLIPFKALLVGHTGWYSFPILQYFSVYIFGVFIGRQLYEHDATPTIKKLVKLLSFLLVIISAVIVFTTGDIATLLLRYPPSIPFIAVGLSFALFLVYIVSKLSELRDMPLTRTALLLLGQNTYAILVAHTLIVFFFAASGLPEVHSVILVGILTTLSLMFSVYGAKILPFNYQFGLTAVAWCKCEARSCTHAREHHLVVGMKQIIFRIISIQDVLSVRIGNRKYSLISHWSIAFGMLFVLLAASPLGLAENNAYFEQTIGALSGNTNRTWFLTTKNEPLIYAITIPKELLEGQNDVVVSYQLDDQHVQPFPLQHENTGEIELSRDELPPGKHRIASIITVHDTPYRTQETVFYISAPLLVTWTIDWEGYDVANEYLTQMASISDKRGLPMTHLFNPEIYIAENITPERAEELTNWVRERNTFHDEEIGLHLHMFPELVENAGVEPKTEPIWGGGFTPGYDVLTTAYGKEDMVQIFLNAKELFAEHNLPEPLSYRAGAWYANLETLQAAQDTGFLIDTSGRTAYDFGTKNISGPWDLRETSQPYFPSTTNQNSSNPPPRLSIMEIPNNGADSYWYRQDQLISRFDANYAGDALLVPKQVTFLSHPHWFNHENNNNKVENLFSYIDQFTYDHDRGPVIYGTLIDVYELWKE